MPNYVKYMGEDHAGLSPLIWHDCPCVDELMFGPRVGVSHYDDFTGGSVDGTTLAARSGYMVFGSTGATNSSGSEEFGVLQLSSDGDDEGASILSDDIVQISSNKKQMWFEARIKTSTIADTKHGFFLGFLEDTATLSATVPIAADGTLADQNLCGFHRLEGDGDKVDLVYKANGVTAVTMYADAATLVADTYIKLGMRFDPDETITAAAAYGGSGGTASLRFYADNTLLADSEENAMVIPNATGTDFPADVAMGLCFAVLNATGTTPGNSEIDWWRCVQLK